jgi:hypothetical protein
MTIHTATPAGARAASAWANYPGDTRYALGQVVGPNTLRETLTVVAAEYDDEANTTRLGFAYGLVDGAQLPPWLQPRHPVYGVPTAAASS